MSQSFVSFLKVDSLVKVFIFVGRQFHKLAPFIEKTFWAKDVLQNGTLQSPPVAALVDLEVSSLFTNLQSGSGASPVKHLKNNFVSKINKINKILDFMLT